VKTCHYTHLTAHCFATDHPRGKLRQGSYPTISGIRPYPPILDPASIQPQSTTDQQGGKADVAQDSGSFHCLVPDVTMVSRDGRPFLGHVATATSTGIDKTSPQDTPASRLLLPYKRVGQGSTRGNTTTNQPTNKQRHTTHRSISQAITLVLSFPLRPGLGSLSHSL
jgi:hypothetical protein